MTRDEEAGVQLPEPGEAQAEAPETVEPEDGEGRTVRTALRDDVTVVEDGGAGAPDVVDTTTGEVARLDDPGDVRPTDDPPDRDAPGSDLAGGGADVLDEQPSVPVETDAERADAPESADAAADSDLIDLDPTGRSDSDTDGVTTDGDAGEPRVAREEPTDLTADEAIVGLPPAVADGAVATADEAGTADDAADGGSGEAGDGAPDGEGATGTLADARADTETDRPTDGTDPDPSDEPTAVALPTGLAPAAAAAGSVEPGDEATVVTSLPVAPPEPVYEEVAASYVVQDGPVEMSPSQLRVDFGAHLEANYQRLVAQMYAITLSAEQAHSVVQDAYSRAWRNWSVIGRSADPTGWVRRVAVRTTMRSWRHLLARFGIPLATPKVAEGLDERTTELLATLRELPAPERRSVVLFHMAGLSPGEIAAVEQVSPSTISTRLDRARRAVLGDTDDLLTGVMELPGVVLDNDRGFVGQLSLPAEPVAPLDDRWERTQSWNGGPDGSWIVSEPPPWDAPNSDDWPRFRPDPEVQQPPPAGGDAAKADVRPAKRDWSAPWTPRGDATADGADDGTRTKDDEVTTGTVHTGRKDSEDER